MNTSLGENLHNLQQWYTLGLPQIDPTIAPVTVSLYASTLFGVVRHATDIYDVRQVEDMHLAYSTKTRPTFRAAWKLLRECFEKTGSAVPPEIPTMPGFRLAKNRPIVFIPQVETAIRTILRKGSTEKPETISSMALAQATWSQTDIALDLCVVRQGVRQYMSTDHEVWMAFVTLKGWAVGHRREPNPEGPLIPMRPESPIPATAGLLRQIAGHGA